MDAQGDQNYAKCWSVLYATGLWRQELTIKCSCYFSLAPNSFCFRNGEALRWWRQQIRHTIWREDFWAWQWGFLPRPHLRTAARCFFHLRLLLSGLSTFTKTFIRQNVWNETANLTNASIRSFGHRKSKERRKYPPRSWIPTRRKEKWERKAMAGAFLPPFAVRAQYVNFSWNWFISLSVWVREKCEF